MKPNFALTLSFDGIGLLHRSYPGWHHVGEVSLATADLAADLAELRDTALALDPAGITCKLVIPDDQIKYLDFDAGGATGDALKQAVRDHLDGATPYALDDLAYDWSVEAGQVHVAAVARETLDEAEDFAASHDFNPVCFVAMPGPGRFVGEPWFGETAQAAQHIPEGQTLDRDTAAIRVIGPAPRQAAQTDTPQPVPDHTPEAAAPTPDDTAEDQPDTPAEAPLAAPPAPTETPAEAADDSAPAFRSIRASREDEGPPAAPRLAGVARSGQTPASEAPALTGHPEGAQPDIAASETAATLTASPEDRQQPALERERATESAVSSFFTRRSAVPATAAATAPPPPADEKQRMTIFGARDTDQVGGKPRYLGLILTAALLLFLVAVAAWASIFTEDGLSRLFRDPPAPQVADVPDRPAPDPTAETAAAPDTDTAPDTTPSGTELASLPHDQAGTGTGTEAASQPPLSRPAPADLSADAARARYAATGIWQMAPQAPSAPGVLTLDDFYQTSIDTPVKSSDAVALPGLDGLRPGTRPETPLAPPPAGTTFALDDRGLVIATEDGALTPQGVRVFAGRPALTPPDVPDRPALMATVLPEEEVLRLGAVRPRPRPDDLSERNERGALGTGGRTQSELAGLRPRLRPQSAQEAAMQAATVDSDAVEAAIAEAAQDDTPAAIASATPQAVGASLKPSLRPGDFQQKVARARQAQQATPVAANQRMRASTPTATTVARAATEDNVISMRKVSLIGVYGGPSNRRALVRLSNGDFEKVQVGDRLDGGQVAAIGTSELRYVKRGRSIVLKMPRG